MSLEMRATIWSSWYYCLSSGLCSSSGPSSPQLVSKPYPIILVYSLELLQRHWYHLKWCRGFFKQCRILETIKAFSWICWILTTFLIPLSLLRMRRAPEDDHMGTRRNVVNGNRAGETKGLRHEPAVTVWSNRGWTDTFWNPRCFLPLHIFLLSLLK